MATGELKRESIRGEELDNEFIAATVARLARRPPRIAQMTLAAIAFEYLRLYKDREAAIGALMANVGNWMQTMDRLVPETKQ